MPALHAPMWLTPALIGTAIASLALAVWALLRSRRTSEPRPRPPAAVVVTGFAAACCTAYSADTSWRFAADHLDMAGTTERAALFAAGEIALFATALMARHNIREYGSPGVPGLLVWAITGVQIIPAYSESGLLGGTVRAFFGPLCAALLWHLAMGIELRHIKPGALSSGLAASIGRELRERARARLGLAVRDRTAEQIARDRALARAVRLASRGRLSDWGKRRLASAVARAHVATDPAQKRRLIAELEVRRGAAELCTIPLRSPWRQPPAAPTPPPPVEALTVEQLARMHPLDAVRTVRSAHPGLHPSALAALCRGYRLEVTEQMVRIAIGAGNPSAPEVHLDRMPRVHPQVHSDPAPEVHPQVHPKRPALVLDLAPMDAVPHPAMAAPAPRTNGHVRTPAKPGPGAPKTAPAGAPPSAPDGVPADVWAKALKKYPDKVPSVRRVKAQMSVGQDRAKAIHDALKECTQTAPGGTP